MKRHPGASCLVAFVFAAAASSVSFALGAHSAHPAHPPTEASWHGDKLLETADKLDSEATQLIKKGSLLRKQIKQQQQAILELNAGHKKDKAQQELAAQLERSLSLQQQGGSKRKQAAELRAEAVDQFANDMRSRWPEWVTTSQPIQLNNQFQRNKPSVGAHNSRARSVHPRKQTLAGAPQTATAKGMTLALPELSGQLLPEGLDTRSFAISRERQFVAHIELEQEPTGPDESALTLNTLHSWRLLLSDIHGKRVADANIVFRGHMPGHVHGLPTQPKITRQLDQGVYRISGVKFQMRGWWVIELLLEAEGFSKDSVRFNLSL